MRSLTSVPYKWLALLTASLGSFLATIDASIVTVSFPALTRAFAIEPSLVLWVTVAYLLVSLGLMLTLGKLGDLLGRKRIYTAGFAIYTAGLVLCSLAQGIVQLILSRMAQGVGAAMVISLGVAIVVAAFPTAQRGRALGIQGAAVSAGLLAGPALGGFLLEWLDWRAIFYSRIPIGLLGTAMAWALLVEDEPARRDFRFDWPGALALFLTLSCLLLFLNVGGRIGPGAPPSLALAAAAALFAWLFLRQERRCAEPTVDLSLFESPRFLGGNLSLSFLFFALGSFGFLMPFYLIEGLGRSAWETGLTIAIVPFSTMLVAPLSGRLSDRIGSRPLCTAGVALCSLAAGLISRLGGDATTGEIVVRLALFGIGSGLFQSPNNSSIIGAAPRNRLGTASAMIATFRQVSISFGIAVSGTLFASERLWLAEEIARHTADPLAVARLSAIGSFQHTLLIASLICALGILPALFRERKDPPAR